MKSISIRQHETGTVLASVSAHVGPDAITIKRLGWRKLEEAERAHRKQAFAQLEEMGGPEVIKRIQDARGKDDKPEVKPDLVASRYDRGTLLTIGVVLLDDQPQTPEALDNLEPETVDAVAREIVRLSRPALFETEAGRKND